MKTSPLVMMSELLIVLILMFGLEEGGQVSTQAVESTIAVSGTEREEVPELSQNGHISAGLMVILQLDGRLTLSTGNDVELADIPDLMRQESYPGVTVQPVAGISYQQVHRLALALDELGIAVELAAERDLTKTGGSE